MKTSTLIKNFCEIALAGTAGGLCATYKSEIWKFFTQTDIQIFLVQKTTETINKKSLPELYQSNKKNFICQKKHTKQIDKNCKLEIIKGNTSNKLIEHSQLFAENEEKIKKSELKKDSIYKLIINAYKFSSLEEVDLLTDKKLTFGTFKFLKRIDNFETNSISNIFLGTAFGIEKNLTNVGKGKYKCGFSNSSTELKKNGKSISCEIYKFQNSPKKITDIDYKKSEKLIDDSDINNKTGTFFTINFITNNLDMLEEGLNKQYPIIVWASQKHDSCEDMSIIFNTKIFKLKPEYYGWGNLEEKDKLMIVKKVQDSTVIDSELMK